MANRPNALRSAQRPPSAPISVAKAQGSPRLWAIVAVVGLAQFAWLAWILGEPLPNAGNGGGGVITRSYMLWRFLPEVVPGLAYRDTFLANMVEQLSHVENLPQRIPVVAAAALILLCAVAIGRWVLRLLRLFDRLSPLERLGVAFGVGTALLGCLTLILGRMGWLSPWSARVGLALPIVAELIVQLRGRRTQRATNPAAQAFAWSWSEGSILVAVAPFLVIMALGSMLPTIDFDSIEYHLQGPKEYFQAGRITFLPHNVYTSMPFSIEMLHLLGMEVWNDWWWGALTGQLLVACFAPMAGLMVWLTARRWGSPRAAWVATLAYLSAPWIYRLAAIPYVEGPLCYYHAALLWTTGMAWFESSESKTPFWALVGLLAGGAMATKYPGLISAVLPFGAVSLLSSVQNRTYKHSIAFALGVAVVMAPWLIKNVVDTRNPVYPLGYKVFGGDHWDAEQDTKWARAHGPRPIKLELLKESILEVAGRSDWQSPAFTAFAPLAFIGLARRKGSWIFLAFVVYIFATWWLFTHRLDRFWLPLLPALAILAGRGADAFRHRAWTVLVSLVLGICVLTNFIYCSTSLAGLEDWTGDLLKLRSDIPRLLNAPLVTMEASLPPNARPLLIGQAAVFHLRGPIAYNTVFNKETIEILARGRSIAEIRRALAERGLTHLYVDWHEIARYRSPGNYGFTDFVTPELLQSWVAAGLLNPPASMGGKQELYEIRAGGSS